MVVRASLEKSTYVRAKRVRAAIREHPARPYVFDMLASGETDNRALPLIDRKQFLRDSFDNTTQPVYVVGIASADARVFEQVELRVGVRTRVAHLTVSFSQWSSAPNPEILRALLK